MTTVLSDRERSKLDTGDDDAFYGRPRFVTHADDAFLARLTDLYASVLDPGDRVFDAMSSWVSHSGNSAEAHGFSRGRKRVSSVQPPTSIGISDSPS